MSYRTLQQDNWVDEQRAKIDYLEDFIGVSAADYMRQSAAEMISNGQWDELENTLDGHIDVAETVAERDLDYARGK